MLAVVVYMASITREPCPVNARNHLVNSGSLCCSSYSYKCIYYYYYCAVLFCTVLKTVSLMHHSSSSIVVQMFHAILFFFRLLRCVERQASHK